MTLKRKGCLAVLIILALCALGASRVAYLIVYSDRAYSKEIAAYQAELQLMREEARVADEARESDPDLIRVDEALDRIQSVRYKDMHKPMQAYLRDPNSTGLPNGMVGLTETYAQLRQMNLIGDFETFIDPDKYGLEGSFERMKDYLVQWDDLDTVKEATEKGWLPSPGDPGIMYGWFPYSRSFWFLSARSAVQAERGDGEAALDTCLAQYRFLHSEYSASRAGLGGSVDFALMAILPTLDPGDQRREELLEIFAKRANTSNLPTSILRIAVAEKEGSHYAFMTPGPLRFVGAFELYTKAREKVSTIEMTPFQRQAAAMANPPTEPEGITGFLGISTYYFLGEIDRLHDRFWMDAYHYDILQVVFALYDYKTEHGTYPDALEALVPSHLRAVPVDPFTGGSMAYDTTERGFQILSPFSRMHYSARRADSGEAILWESAE
jgi:hypothetical protein